MKAAILIFPLFLLLSKTSCQVAKQPQKVDFKYVSLPDSVYSQIIAFYRDKENRDSIVGQITVFNIKYPNDYQYKEGLFRFRISGPHFTSYYFINKKNKVHIFQEKSTIGIIGELKEFIASLNISESEKIELVELTALMLREEYKIENN